MMRRKTRPTAKHLTVAVACLALVVGLGCGLISRMSGSTSDSVDDTLAAIGDDPQAALEYLAPEEDGSVDGNGVWVPGQTTTDRWTMLTSRDRGEGAEPLTTAVAGASARRVQSQDATDERAAWVTGKGLDYAAGLSEQSFSAKVKNNVAVILGNSMAEIEDGVTRTRDTSGIESDSWDSGRPAVLADDHGEDFKTLMKMWARTIPL